MNADPRMVKRVHSLCRGDISRAGHEIRNGIKRLRRYGRVKGFVLFSISKDFRCFHASEKTPKILTIALTQCYFQMQSKTCDAMEIRKKNVNKDTGNSLSLKGFVFRKSLLIYRNANWWKIYSVILLCLEIQAN